MAAMKSSMGRGSNPSIGVSVAENLTPSPFCPVSMRTMAGGAGGSSAFNSTSLNVMGKRIENVPSVGVATPAGTSLR